jgi:hypothetical protein
MRSTSLRSDYRSVPEATAGDVISSEIGEFEREPVTSDALTHGLSVHLGERIERWPGHAYSSSTTTGGSGS